MGKLINKNIKLLCDDSSGIMSLYSAYDGVSKGRKPIIFIRGHAGKYTVNTKQILDNAPNDEQLVKMHEGFYYDENIHYPLIAEYTYKDNMERKIKEYDPQSLTTQVFADSIIEMLEKENLQSVDMVGSSVGANICMLASPSPRIDRVSAVTPTMPYSYLADEEQIKKFKTKSLIDLIIYFIAKAYLDHNYAFVEDMASAFRDSEELKKMIDPSKIFVAAGAVTKPLSHDLYKKFLEFCIVTSARRITKNTGFPSDGAIVTDEEFLKSLGIQYEISQENFHVWCDQAESILTRAYYNLEKVGPSRTRTK